MNTSNGYLLLFRSADWYKGLSPEQMQQTVESWVAWVNRLREEEKCAASHPLEREGKVISGPARAVSDGPLAEARETIGGYLVLTVGSLEEAVAIAQQCPGLPHGIDVEVRPIAGEAPLLEESDAQELTQL